MATSLRLGASALRSSRAIANPVAQSIAFNGLRCYSNGKAKVFLIPFQAYVLVTDCLIFFSPSRTPSPISSLPSSRRSRSSGSMQPLLPPTVRDTIIANRVESVQGARQQGPRRSHPRPGVRWCSWCKVPCLGGRVTARREYPDKQLTDGLGLCFGL